MTPNSKRYVWINVYEEEDPCISACGGITHNTLEAAYRAAFCSDRRLSHRIKLNIFTGEGVLEENNSGIAVQR